MSIYDVIIIGGGVSALPCALDLIQNGLTVLLIDKGPLQRSASIPHEICNGAGGSGLFSDGKFSFYPAGTKVWSLENKQQIINALKSTIASLNQAYQESHHVAKAECKGMPLSEKELIDSVQNHESVMEQVNSEWQLKPYPCVYMPLETRIKLLETYLKVLKPHILPECIVHEISRHQDSKLYQVQYQRNNNFQETHIAQARNIVCAGGRFMPMFLRLPNTCKRIFRRIEMGVRIQCDSANCTWQQMKGVDPKYINEDSKHKLQWRTFCCCRQGEVALSSYNGLYSYSGRADCAPTKFSNTGFNVRCYDASLQPEFLQLIRKMRLTKPDKQPFAIEFSEFMSNNNDKVKQIYGSMLQPLQEGIRKFAELFPAIVENPGGVKMFGPTVEGCGEYWEVDENLKVTGDDNIWIGGDSSGIFRGIVPALVSGHYIAQQIKQSLLKGLNQMQYFYECQKRIETAHSVAYNQLLNEIINEDQKDGDQRNNVKKPCFHCQREFTPDNPENYFCSDECLKIKHYYQSGNYSHEWIRNSFPISHVPRGKLLNKITDDISYSHTYPEFKGKHESEALHEIHIFLAPINPDANTVKRYTEACELWNRMNSGKQNFKPMKPCYLALEFRDKDDQGNFTDVGTEVCVMQSARYIQSNNMEYIVEQCHADAEFFMLHGFDVLREKVEESIYGIQGIPQTTEEMAQYPTKYFEFHMRVQKRFSAETDPITEEEIKQLKRISFEFGQKFGIPIPLSYNKAKSLEGVHQRFLNLRFRAIGAQEAIRRVREVQEAVNTQTQFMIGKIISEFVSIDSYEQLDNGWIQ
jgi:uncharacterized FAD-dependent dehydrogenase